MPTRETLTDSDGPRVQIPIGADRPGLTIDGEFMTVFELPDDAADAYRQYARQGGNVRIYQCETCGYLTDSDALSTTSRRSYECGGCGNRTASSGLQRSAETGFTRVHGPHTDDDTVDVVMVLPESKCPADHGPAVLNKGERFVATEINEEAVECEGCVPNHPSHLGKLQNEVTGEITQSEMLDRVAEAVQAFREA